MAHYERATKSLPSSKRENKMMGGSAETSGEGDGNERTGFVACCLDPRHESTAVLSQALILCTAVSTLISSSAGSLCTAYLRKHSSRIDTVLLG